MKLKINKRTLVVSSITLALVGGVSAFAYVSQNVDASGKGSTAALKPITATVAGVPEDFAPGDTAIVKLHVTNPNRFPVDLVALAFKVTAPGTDKCPAGSFTIDSVTGGRAPAGESDAATARLVFSNLPSTQQNTCLGEALTVTATAS